jgi:hypothetical protein
MIGNWVKIKSSSCYINLSQVFVIAIEFASNIRYIYQYWLLNSNIKFLAQNIVFLFNFLPQCLTALTVSDQFLPWLMYYYDLCIYHSGNVFFHMFIIEMILIFVSSFGVLQLYWIWLVIISVFWWRLEFSLCTIIASISGDVLFLPSSLFLSLTFSLPQNSWCTLNRAPGNWDIYFWH